MIDNKHTAVTKHT